VPFFCAFRSAFGGSIGIRLVLLGLVVMPTTELVLPFNVDGHFCDSYLNLVAQSESKILDAKMELQEQMLLPPFKI